MKNIVSVTELRDNMASFVDQVNDDNAPVTIIRHSRPAAVMISFEVYKSLLARQDELLQLLADTPKDMK